MAETITGGAYQDEHGRWVDADGRLLKKPQIGEARDLADARQAERDEQQRQALTIEAQRDPTARALVAALARPVGVSTAESSAPTK